MARSRHTFTSDRERRLWWWTVAAVVAIYATIGLARSVAVEVRHRGLVDTVFFWVFIAMVVAVVLVATRARPSGVEVGVALGVVAVYVLVFLRMALPEERTHLVEYGIVAVLVHEALVERSEHGRPVPLPWLWSFGVTSLVGTVDELIQLAVPSRVFDLVDIAVNAIAAALALVALVALRWARSRRPGRSVSA